MSVKKRGLGSGLDTLLGVSREIEEAQKSATEVKATAGKTEAKQSNLLELPIDQIERGQYQPRRYFDEDALSELADSIKEQGLLQPIVVRSLSKNKYEIIAGERRWRASQLAGLHSISVVIKELDDQAAMVVALIENLQREDLNPMEEAYALSRLKDEFELTHDQVAKAVGKSRTTVTNLLRLTSLTEAVRKMVENTDLEMGHARALISLEAAQQKEAAIQIVEKAMSVRQAEALVRNLGTGKSKEASIAAKPDADIQRLEQQLSEKLGAASSIQHKTNGKGKLVISYNSADELEGILSHFKL
jgi:ParB family chromosome partitioning protein|tara:strand:+ start:77730 stop:78638 length:909 start_codon:yes stop_codon:yes gene_type:complete